MNNEISEVKTFSHAKGGGFRGRMSESDQREVRADPCADDNDEANKKRGVTEDIRQASDGALLRRRAAMMLGLELADRADGLLDVDGQDRRRQVRVNQMFILDAHREVVATEWIVVSVPLDANERGGKRMRQPWHFLIRTVLIGPGA